MKILILFIIAFSSCFATELTNFNLTDSTILNIYVDLFLTISIYILPLFGALSLIGSK